MTDEVRQTSDSGASKGTEGPQFSTSDSGATKQVKEARYDMIPADALDELARHYGKGAEKYPPFRRVDLPVSEEAIREAVAKVCDCGAH